MEFCKGVFEIFKENNQNKNFFFHTSCQQILIEADAVKFESVITNLLSNACKYSDEGATISLGISTRNNNVEIIVSDDGVGYQTQINLLCSNECSGLRQHQNYEKEQVLVYI